MHSTLTQTSIASAPRRRRKALHTSTALGLQRKPLWIQAFSKLCISVHPWECVSEIPPIKETSEVRVWEILGFYRSSLGGLEATQVFNNFRHKLGFPQLTSEIKGRAGETDQSHESVTIIDSAKTHLRNSAFESV